MAVGIQIKSVCVTLSIILIVQLLGGCSHPYRTEIIAYVAHDEKYAALPRGVQRIDALWAKAVELTGSNTAALDLLGEYAVDEGLRLRHPFDTGLTEEGPLSPTDKSGHFFAHAMWRYNDHYRLIPVRGFNSVGWEVAGEIRSWFGLGSPFNWKDIWANELGWEFGKAVHASRNDRNARLQPSDIIKNAERFRPDELKSADSNSG